MTQAIRRSHTALFSALAFAVVVVLLVVVLATRQPATSKIDKSPLLGKLAPALVGEMMSGGGGTFDLGTAQGTVVLVNFFATWCVPCIQEHDDLRRFADAHAAAGDATVVSVVFSDEPSNVRRFFTRNGGDWPVVDDDDGAIATSWGVARVPESYLVGPDGTVLSKITGGVQYDALEDLFARATGG